MRLDQGQAGASPLDPGKLHLENQNYLVNKIAALNQRAENWLAGKPCLLWENHVHGDVAIVLKIRLGSGKPKNHPAKRNIRQANPRTFNMFDIGDLRYWRDKPVLVDVVQIGNPPDKITKSASAIVGTIGLDFFQDDLLQIIILEKERVEKALSSSSFASGRLFGRLKGPLNVCPFRAEREHDALIGNVVRSSQTRNEIVESTPKAVDAISNRQGDRDCHRDMGHQAVSVVRLIEFHPYWVGVFFNGLLPADADLVSVASCPVDLEPRAIED